VDQVTPAGVVDRDTEELATAQLLNRRPTHRAGSSGRADRAFTGSEHFGNLPRDHLAILMQLNNALRVRRCAGKVRALVKEPHLVGARCERLPIRLDLFSDRHRGYSVRFPSRLMMGSGGRHQHGNGNRAQQ
jgi:hypothetical protein